MRQRVIGGSQTQVRVVCIGKLTPEQWEEYDNVAEWCARNGFSGEPGDPLPNLLSSEVHDEINSDTDAFAERVRGAAYAIAREAARESE